MRIKLLAGAGAATALLTGAVLMSPALAGHTPTFDDPILAPLDGTDDGRPQKISSHGVELKTKSETTVRSLDLEYAPGAVSGWHSHPGIVLAVVETGSVTRQVGCTVETFEEGEAFYEVGPHNVSNPGSEVAVLRIMHIYPSSETQLRHNEPAPDCE